jgi:hypothetical protein
VTAINPYEPPREVLQPLAAPGTLPVRATGILTADDFVDTLKAVGQWRPRLVQKVIVVLAVGSVLVAFVAYGVDGLLVVVPPLGAACALVLWGTIAGKRRLEKIWNARPENREPMSWTFSEEGLYVETVNSKHFHAWNGFTKGTIWPDKLILTQQGEGMWNFIPRRFFATEGDWQAVTQLVAGQLPVRQIGGQ